MPDRWKVAAIALMLLGVLLFTIKNIDLRIVAPERQLAGPEETQTVRSLDPGPPPGYIQLNHTYYKFVTSKTFWTNARHLCVKDGGDLVTIESKDKHNLLAKKANTLDGACDTPIINMAAFWIGASDIEQEGTYRWVHTQQVLGTGGAPLPWFKGDPNNWGTDGEDCVAMANFGGVTWEWIDYACGITCCYICEITRP